MLGYPQFPRCLQFTSYTCGSCCTYAIATFFGAEVSYNEVKSLIGTDSNGTEEGPIVRFLRAQGMRVSCRDPLSWTGLVSALAKSNVVLVGLDGDHYGVVHAYDEDEDEVYLADPSLRRQIGRRISSAQFRARWQRDGVIVRPRRA